MRSLWQRLRLAFRPVLQTGNTEALARFIAAGAQSVEHTEVRLFNLLEENAIDTAYLNDSSVVLFGTPTYVANMSWQMKKWFDTDWSVKLGGKLGGVFATENAPYGGGAEIAMMTLVNHMLVKGMLVYSSGAEFDRPFIHIGPAGIRDRILEMEEHCKTYGRRMALKAHTLFDRRESHK